eukprot:CAMPEP_0197569252 /NCGR_PEP_ID=MMETSP1320-20131121/38689_1 /TAXON_ID=91990 /ORGANISM="Bolidomonas sp., Strain RCC2347" /LENGTH=54 /DNA_ID=CAMNT_0043131599 /DNA_START=24 /DNA_END=188 /DNA_ORIENTATION=+
MTPWYFVLPSSAVYRTAPRRTFTHFAAFFALEAAKAGALEDDWRLRFREVGGVA